MHLTWLDFVVLGIYFAGLGLIGYLAGRKQDTLDDYFLGDRQTHWLLAGISIIATLLSTLTYLALPGEIIAHGIGYFYSIFAFVLIIPMVNYIIIPTLMKLRVASVYDYLEQRYSFSTRMLGASIFVLTRVIWVGIVLYTASFALAQMTNWNIFNIALVMGIITTLYTTFGGFRAVIWSDFAQFALLFGGAVFIPLYIAIQTGSTPVDWWQDLEINRRTQVVFVSSDFTVRMTVIAIFLDVLVWNLCTHGSDQLAAQRYLSTPSVQSARRSVWVCTICNVMLFLLLGLCGMGLFHFYYHGHELAASADTAAVHAAEFDKLSRKEADGLMSRFIGKQLPPGVSGLILAALLAAAMSSVSSAVNSVSTVVSTDFIGRLRKTKASPRFEYISARLIAGLTGSLGVIFMIIVLDVKQKYGWNLTAMVNHLNHFFVAPLGAVFLCGIVLRRPGPLAAWIGFLAGALTSGMVSFSKDLFRMEKELSFTWIMPASMLVSVTTIWLCGWIWPRGTAQPETDSTSP